MRTGVVLNDTAHGRNDTPYSAEYWTFSAMAGQQIQFQLVNASEPGVAFDLDGPAGWNGFSNLVNNSGLVNLPFDGVYTLTAHRREYDIA